MTSRGGMSEKEQIRTQVGEKYKHEHKTNVWNKTETVSTLFH